MVTYEVYAQDNQRQEPILDRGEDSSGTKGAILARVARAARNRSPTSYWRAAPLAPFREQQLKQHSTPDSLATTFSFLTPPLIPKLSPTSCTRPDLLICGRGVALYACILEGECS